MKKKKRWKSKKFTDDTPDGQSLREIAMRVGAVEVKNAKRKYFAPYTSSFETWKRCNGDLSPSQHVYAIIHHSKRVGALETRMIYFNDFDTQEEVDAFIGEWERDKATPEQIAFANAQDEIHRAAIFHERCIKLHHSCALSLEPRYTQPAQEYCDFARGSAPAYRQYQKDTPCDE